MMVTEGQRYFSPAKASVALLGKATPERLSAFFDAVFAVLITVPVLDLRPPDLPSCEGLVDLWPR